MWASQFIGILLIIIQCRYSVLGANSRNEDGFHHMDKFCHNEVSDIDVLIQYLIEMGLSESSLHASKRKRSDPKRMCEIYNFLPISSHNTACSSASTRYNAAAITDYNHYDYPTWEEAILPIQRSTM